MPRKMIIFPLLALFLSFTLPATSQDTPSLGELARQAQKEKNKKPAGKVITNDDIAPSDAENGGSGGCADVDKKSENSCETCSTEFALQYMERLQGIMTEMESLDFADLVEIALEGTNKQFSGRSQWEQKVKAAKTTYIARGNEIIQRAKQVLASVEASKEIRKPDDPRMKSLAKQLQALTQEGLCADTAFDAVIREGRTLAGKTSAH